MVRSLLAYYAEAVMAAAARGAGCVRGCSGRGDCLNGTCLCEIRYAGDECAGPNMPYHACIGGVFLFVAFVCAVQLVMCVVTEYRRLKAPTFLRACKITTQKMLYFVAFLASLIRGAYFVSPSAFQEGWATSLLSAYYPLLMSGSSLIVCFWAEVFHLRDMRWERPQFLSKSFLGFVTFNFISYSLLVAEFVTTTLADTLPEKKSFYQHIFNGCYAVLLFIVVIFFLIYGIEVYFRLRGGFLTETRVCTIVSRRRPSQGPSTSSAEPDEAHDTLVTKQGVRTELTATTSINQSQLHQSRVGLLSQALMLILIVGFLASETLSELWKTKVPVNSRNWHDLVFRLAEIGVALWFPCVLWNCMAPERLWILNPRRLLARQLDDAKLAEVSAAPQTERADDSKQADGSSTSLVGDCWICYDGDRPEPLIRPCRCTGDVSSVHHDCLRRWLVESAANVDGLRCKVCNAPYEVEESNRVVWERGFTAGHWLRTCAAVCVMCGAAAGAWVAVQLFTSPVVRVLAAGLALLVCYVGLRFLGMNTVTAYQRAKVSALNIAEPATEHKAPVATISNSVTVDMAKGSSRKSVPN